MRRVLLAMILVLATTANGRAETTFVASLDGLQNVPPIPAVDATGTALLVLNGDELTFTITYQGLSSREIAAHIHNARAGVNGGVAFTLPLGTPKQGTWQIPPEMVTELEAGRLYINIHTELYEAGEIRGQIMQQQVPVESATFGSLKHRYR
jgi:hypothetical protein